MAEIVTCIEEIFRGSPAKIVISKPVSGTEYIRVVVVNKEKYYQIEKYTEKQVFHENLTVDEAVVYCKKMMENDFRQLNAWTAGKEYAVSVSKKGKVLFNSRKAVNECKVNTEHNRKKNYILNEGDDIPALRDMGIFTAQGRVSAPMQDKFRQINRFVEIIDDELKNYDRDEITVIDFGCGKSYLTFILYHYLTVIRKIKVKMTGLDLKKDVVEKCNVTAKKYGYENLSFEVGDINGYHFDGRVDMVITLHACDTATDYALYNAVKWGAEMIFSVPCCQHELNSQIKSEDFAVLTNYGIVKERVAALMTDAVRGNLLECCGYRTQLMEFVDFSHTPKNILIRAKKRGRTKNAEKYLSEVKKLCGEFSLEPTFLRLLRNDGLI